MQGQDKKLKSVVGVGSIIAIFLMVILVNKNKTSINDTITTQPIDNNRQLASSRISESNEFTSQWKKNIASQIAETSDIPSAKPSRQPNSLERLVFGDLKGYYLIQMDGLKVKEMRLNQKYKPAEAPRYLGEEFNFLNTHRDLWWISFSSLSLKERDDQKSVLSLLDSSNKTIGEAYFSWDNNGSLISLKIEKK